jgi:phage shock protein A
MKEDKMGVLGRLGTVLKSNINALINKAEDPQKMLDQIIMDMQEDLIEVKREVAGAIADEKRLERAMTEARTRSQGWEKKAMIALENNDENLATEALKRQSADEDTANQYEQQWLAQREAVDKLKSALMQLNDKIEEARRKKNLLIARAKRAEAQKRINKTMSSLTDHNAFDSFARMEQKVYDMEAKADAETELNAEMAGDNLDDKFKALEADSNVQDKLAALKAKMGK